MLGDLRARLVEPVLGYPAIHPFAVHAARQRPTAVARVAGTGAMAGRLAALAGERDQRARTEIADGAQFLAQFVPDTPQSVDVPGMGHEGLLPRLYH